MWNNVFNNNFCVLVILDKKHESIKIKYPYKFMYTLPILAVVASITITVSTRMEILYMLVGKLKYYRAHLDGTAYSNIIS